MERENNGGKGADHGEDLIFITCWKYLLLNCVMSC